MRAERFGGIVATEHPAMLAWVDRDFMRHLGAPESPLWRGEAEVAPWERLSAPLEVHLQATRRCNAACSHCYVDAGAPLPGEFDGPAMRATIDTLAGMGVFSIAMGGGEAMLREDLFDLADYARSRGLIPNLTTNGTLLTGEIARRCRVFGQVNVSMDALPGGAEGPRPNSLLKAARNALDLLLGAEVRCGINAVMDRESFERVESLVEYAAARRLADVELLRYKPFGRAAADLYHARRLTTEQGARFWPTIRALMERFAFNIKVDCSFLPFLCAHDAEVEVMQKLGVMGCDGGNVLAGITPDGRVAGCSFVEGHLDARDLAARWHDAPEFERFRRWHEGAREPCRSCSYLSVCKGGCHAVAHFVTGDFHAPDPECPRVLALGASRGHEPTGFGLATEGTARLCRDQTKIHRPGAEHAEKKSTADERGGR